MAGPRLDLVDLELFDHMSSKVYEINGGIATLMVVSRDKFPEGIGGDGDSLARFRWKPDRGARGCRCSQQRREETRSGPSDRKCHSTQKIAACTLSLDCGVLILQASHEYSTVFLSDSIGISDLLEPFRIFRP